MKNKKDYELAVIIEPLFENDNEEEKTAEIEALLDASGAKLFLTVKQKIREINPGTIIGRGKLEEIKNIISENEVDLVVFDGELSPSQQNNVSDVLEVKVINRTSLILDIFAMRARSPEGKILVELAQLKYIYPRLSGKGLSLSRLGGGIGTRGPGETKLETDRRHIKSKIRSLEKSLNEIEKRRQMQQFRREKNGVKTIALVGYTNTGKSTLINILSGSDLLAKDQLFATLDPSARKAHIDGYQVVIFDTVGFIKQLPPDLMEAFKSTLECAVCADLVLNVCDISDNWYMQTETTVRTLNELGVTAPIITVYNKCDLVCDENACGKNSVSISAKTGRGIDELKKKIVDVLFSDLIDKRYTISYTRNFNPLKLRDLCEKYSITYSDDNIIADVRVSEKNLPNLEKYILNTK